MYCCLSRRNVSFAFATLIALVACGSFTLPAQAQGLAGQVDQHLAAGEFGPARNLAANAGDAALRDQLFGNIATAQAAAGSRGAALNSLADIQNDQTRSGALGGVAGMPLGGHGGAASADFDSLIELITATVRPTTWEEVGGPGAIEEFPGGVYVDANGVLKKITPDDSLIVIRRKAATEGGNRDVHADSKLRMVSITRLEREAQLRWADGLPPSEVMANLAGIYRVDYLMVYPESGDIVIAGPAGDWKTNAEGRVVNVDTELPVLQLDDLVVLLRNAVQGDGAFTCSIVPQKENLAATQEFLATSARTPLKPGKAARERWLGQLKNVLGKQNIEFTGIDPRTRVGRVIIEADYHMKLVGMGLEDGVLGLESYLDSLQIAKGEPAPPMNVLRWWFTLNYDAVKATRGHDAFALEGQGVQVLSENEMLTKAGERVHTGKSDEKTAEFAADFTKHFDKLSVKYPVYAELKNIFDLALVAAIVKSEDLPGQVNWHMTHFGDAEKFEVELGEAPQQVDSVLNHRVVHGNQIIAGVSGGVAVRPAKLVQPNVMKTTDTGKLEYDRHNGKPQQLPRRAWWWD